MEHEMRRRLASHMIRLRSMHALTSEEASERAGIGWRHWQRLEAGQCSARVGTLARVATALGVEPGALLA
jgi:hypothetical protein